MLACFHHLEQFTPHQQYYILLGLSTVYEQKGLLGETINIKSLILESETTDVKFSTSRVMIDLGHSLYEQQRYEEALGIYKKAIADSALANDEIVFPLLLNNLGICYYNIENHNHELAEKYLLAALEKSTERDDSIQVCRVHNNLGDLYFDMYEDAKAESFWLLALSEAQQGQYLDEIGNSSFNLSLLYKEFEQYEKSLGYSELYNQTLTKVWNRDKVWELAEQEKAYVVGMKQQEIELKDSENKRKTAEISVKAAQRNGFIIISILGGILGVIFFNMYRSKRKHNEVILDKNEKLENLNQTKDRLFSIIGHDLRSPILALKDRSDRLVTSHKNELPPGALVLAQSNKNALHGMEQLIENVINWGVSQQGDRVVNLQQLDLRRVTEMVHSDYIELLDQKDLTCVIDIPYGAMIGADMHCVKAVLRNVFDNAIKFSTNGSVITLSTELKDEVRQLRVSNVGESIHPDTIEALREDSQQVMTSSGLGLKICQEMMTMIEGGFEIAATDTGTEVILSFKTVEHEEFEHSIG